MSRTCCAQVTVDHLSPPIVQAGTEATVVASGKFPIWPVEVLSDRDDLTIKPAEEKGQFVVSVKGDAHPGVVWFRFVDKASVSQGVPMLVTHHNVVAETEPNDRRRDTAPIECPGVITALLGKNGDSDLYQFELSAKDQFVASVTANELLQSPMDAVMQLLDANGNVIEYSEDVRGFDPQLVYTASSDQTVYVRVFAFPATPNSSIRYAGGKDYRYLLSVTTGPFLDHAFATTDSSESVIPYGYNLTPDLDYQVSPATSVSPPTIYAEDSMGWSFGTKIGGPQVEAIRVADSKDETQDAIPFVALGRIDRPGQTDRHRFLAKKGLTYKIETRSQRTGYLLDSKVALLDSNTGDEIASNDDLSRNQFDSLVKHQAKQDGELLVVVSDTLGSFGPRHTYQLLVSENDPGFELGLSKDVYVVDPGKELEISVTVTRESGFKPSIQVSAVDLPDGVSCESVTSEPKGASAKAVKLKLVNSNSEPFRGTFKIVGSTVAEDKEATPLITKNATFQLRPNLRLKEFWLVGKPSEKSADK